ncbi:hypothetical protein QO016_000076 [Methylobacterium persicinum]|jgi:hypothetical protein|uniref:Uncharacterized protein n=1 Tax=Methylobacterium persicinum TaxID=374426 RepID=A0ABU0HE54_9HYPH|nr:hypothetical protein [Methylobacterium persicinum]
MDGCDKARQLTGWGGIVSHIGANYAGCEIRARFGVCEMKSWHLAHSRQWKIC